MLGLFFLAVAISLDAFSMALGLGVYAYSKKEIFKIGNVVGFFHIFMPFIGIMIGRLLSDRFGMITTIFAGLLIVLLGLQLIYSSIKVENNRKVPTELSIWLFAFSVSLDSFSAGLSLGMVGVKQWISIVFFGIVSMVFTWTGLYLGGKVQVIAGRYSEMLGGIILLLFGVRILFVGR